MIQGKSDGVKSNLLIVRILRLGLQVMGIYIVFILMTGLLKTREAGQRMAKAEAEVSREEEKNLELELTVREATSEAYVERIARDELNMQKPNEMMVVFPDVQKEEQSQGKKSEEKTKIEPNWQKWWELLRL